jgi:hypothetical protein
MTGGAPHFQKTSLCGMMAAPGMPAPFRHLSQPADGAREQEVAGILRRCGRGASDPFRHSRSPGSDAATVEVWRAYQQLLDSKKFDRLTVKPGDKLPVRGIDATVISSGGALIANPLPGAGQVNPSCRNAETYPEDQTENKRSLGTLITFGKLRILDLGELNPR